MATQAPSAKRGGLSFTLLGAVLAILGFGVVFVIGASGGGSKTGAAPAATAPVLIAAHDIQARETLLETSVTVAKFVPADVPPGALIKPADAKNLVAAVTIKKGQPITSNLLVQTGDVIGSAQPAYLPLPSGYVAFTIPTGEQQGVAGFIQAGDYISVIAVVSPKGAATSTSRTVFTNIHVLKICPSTGEVQPAGGAAPTPAKTGGVSSSLTVVLTQCQAEFLNWFVQNESLKYTLESYKDYQPQDAKPDATCPGVGSARGVTEADVRSRWPGLL